MKKFIISVVITILSFASVYAQKTIYHKIQDDKAYYKVESVGKSTKYYKKKLSKGTVSTNFEYVANSISQKAYEGINAQENILRIGNSVSMDEITLLQDEKCIIAYSVENTKTSSKIEVGDKKCLLQVKDAANKELVGCNIMCQIMEKRKSNINGSEGRLIIRPLYIINKENQAVRLLPTDIYKRGKNRANVKFWFSFAIIPVFVAGSKAEIEQNETFELRLE